MTQYSELRRLAREIERETASPRLLKAAAHSLFVSRILRSVPEMRQRRRSLILIARAYRSIVREREAQRPMGVKR